MQLIGVMATMKAVRMHAFGGPEVLEYEDVETPRIGPRDVLLRIEAVAVNPADWKFRAGRLGIPSLPPFPRTPGFDVSGVVEVTGIDVHNFEAGDEVYGRISGGGYAQYATVPANDLVAKPPSVDHIHAASVITPGLTAWQALDTLGLLPGDTILIHGAGGAVGSVAVQLATLRGIRVIATASAEDAAYVHELGALRVIDYKNERFEDIVHSLDGVLDVVGGETRARSWSVLRPGGVLVTTVGPLGPVANPDVRGLAIVMHPNRDQVEELGRMLEDGALIIRIAEVLPLEEARRAHEDAERHLVHGKIILEPTRRLDVPH
jgi:NADPH:quinone reductase-like Zn-dependent oxidoreductase